MALRFRDAQCLRHFERVRREAPAFGVLAREQADPRSEGEDASRGGRGCSACELLRPLQVEDRVVLPAALPPDAADERFGLRGLFVVAGR